MLSDGHTKKRFVLVFVLVLVSISVHILIFFNEMINYY